MTFEFAKYTEITDYALEHFPEYKRNNYCRVFICWDVNDFWLVRVLSDTNGDFEPEPGTFVMERNNIPKDKGEKLTLSKVRRILAEDDFSNWDYEVGQDIEQMITTYLDQGFGVLNRKEVLAA